MFIEVCPHTFVYLYIFIYLYTYICPHTFALPPPCLCKYTLCLPPKPRPPVRTRPHPFAARIQKIARSVLRSLAFLHSLNLIHSDLKPENILIKSYSRFVCWTRACITRVCMSLCVLKNTTLEVEVIWSLLWAVCTQPVLVVFGRRCEVKVIDLGSSCFITDQLSSYVQSRSYRAPEVGGNLTVTFL